MSTNKMSQDAKKEEFKKYLEKAGVLEVLTKSLVSLYEEPDKPGDAVNYLKKTVGGTDNDRAEIERLQSENTELKAKVSILLLSGICVFILKLFTQMASMEEKQAALEAKLEELKKTPVAEPETSAPASMEESSEPAPAPAAAPAPAPAPAG